MVNVTPARVAEMNGRTRALMRWGFLALTAWLSVLATQAMAADYCVGSTAELQTALNAAANPNSELFTTTVKIKQGTYHIGNTTLIAGDRNLMYALELLGGYNSDCSARTINPDNTVIDADAHDLYFEPMADLVMEGLRFQNVTGQFHYVRVSTAADNVTVRLSLNAFVGAGVYVSPGNDPDQDPVSGLTARFINNRVHSYVKPAATQLSAVTINGGTHVRFTGNTIADNAGDHGAFLCLDSDVTIFDNIGWNNVGDDFRVVGAGCGNTPAAATFKNNLYQNITLTGDTSGNIANVDPLFVSAGAGNYRLKVSPTVSPAINTGVVISSVPDVDLAGGTRVIGSTVDMGAYESAVDDTVPSTLVVTNTGDNGGVNPAPNAGTGTLRQAIVDANANPDFSYITFNIPNGTNCGHLIMPVSTDLPTIVYSVRIDGFTQPGSAPNTRSAGDNATRCIVLDGSLGRTNGLNFGGASSQHMTLVGLAFEGFNPGGGTGAAVRVAGGSGSILWGNQFGGAMPLLGLAPNYVNVLLTGLSDNTTVGGTDPAQRNVIAGAIDDGVRVFGSGFFISSGNEIIGNLIGTYGTETAHAGNNIGVHILTHDNTVRGNVIVNNGLDGVLMDQQGAYNNVLDSNRIGVTDQFCSLVLCSETAAGNGRNGIYLSFGPHDNTIYRNRIRYNTSRGVEIGSSAGAVSNNNWLTANSLYSNGAQGTLFTTYNGADNDAAANQADMANRGLNYPVITRAYGGTKKGRVEGTLATTNGNYVIDVFSSAQADAGFPRGEGDLLLKSYYSVIINNALTGQNGSASFSIPFTNGGVSLATRVITLTAADIPGNTSELSAPVVYQCDVIFAHGFDDTTGDKCP